MSKVEKPAEGDGANSPLEDGASASGNKGLNKEKKKRGNVANLIMFKPGQSGNPAGRPKVPDEIIKVLELGSKGAAERLVQLTQDKDGRIALTAIDMLQNRLYGRPTQQVDAQVTTTNVQQAHLQILIDLQQKREQAMKTIEGTVNVGGAENPDEIDPET
jgi:hypothetical protein